MVWWLALSLMRSERRGVGVVIGLGAGSGAPCRGVARTRLVSLATGAIGELVDRQLSIPGMLRPHGTLLADGIPPAVCIEFASNGEV